jgi:hypothetical protein
MIMRRKQRVCKPKQKPKQHAVAAEQAVVAVVEIEEEVATNLSDVCRIPQGAHHRDRLILQNNISLEVFCAQRRAVCRKNIFTFFNFQILIYVNSNDNCCRN